MEVYYSVASIPFFRVDILLSSESVQFGTKMTRMEPNNKVELREMFGSSCLFLGQSPGSRNTQGFYNL